MILPVLPPHLTDHADLFIALKAAAAGGEIIAREYPNTQKVEAKGIGDLVSAVDREADSAIMTILQTHCPTDEVLSEELNPTNANRSKRLWIVDPLDGTAPFLFRLGENIPCVLIALQIEQVTTVGVAFFPLSNEWFYAVKDAGAYKDGQKTSLSPRTELAASWIEMNHYGDAALETDAFTQLSHQLRSKNGARLVTVCSPNSGVALRLLDGESLRSAVIHDNNPTNPKQCAWDTAAIQLIIEESGGTMVNAKGERYDPFKPEMIIVGSESVCREIVKIIV
ncbi:MAG: inositol monophosphatase [Candidatus Peribacteraceae bacterium]|nr:inositol monophosphatase [Candidatus Peribacteraceae bacterium]